MFIPARARISVVGRSRGPAVRLTCLLIRQQVHQQHLTWPDMHP